MNIFDRIKLNIVHIDYWIRNFILKLFTQLLFNNDNFKGVENILIFRTGSLGDSICALPAINIIRKNFPEAKIDILTNAGSKNLVSINHIINKKLINNIIDYLDIPKRQLTQLIKQNKYDLFIELPQDQQTITRQLRNIIWVKMLGIKKALGWEISATRLFPMVQDKYRNFKNERDRLVNILTRNNFKLFDYEYPLNIDDKLTKKISELLIEKKINEQSKNIAIAIGAKRQQNKWPIEYFKEVIEYLNEKEFNTLLVGDNTDFELTKNIINKRVYNFCGKLEPLETSELMKNCKLVLSNDSGPMHLAYAVGTPVIAIFSNRDYPNKWFPPQNNTVLRSNKELCIHCFNQCKFDNECLKKISPAHVIKALKKTLMLE